MSPPTTKVVEFRHYNIYEKRIWYSGFLWFNGDYNTEENWNKAVENIEKIKDNFIEFGFEEFKL